MAEKFTQEKLECISKTMEHKDMVKELLKKMIDILLNRAEHHDDSKMQDPEIDLFTKYTPKLAKLTYGSDEYKECLEKIEPALKHHYANSRHHPEHFKNGIKDMNLIDILEMFVDWYCSSKRHQDGNIRLSIELNQKRFKFTNELKKILENSIELLDE